jgi:hypothetical protein
MDAPDGSITSLSHRVWNEWNPPEAQETAERWYQTFDTKRDIHERIAEKNDLIENHEHFWVFWLACGFGGGLPAEGVWCYICQVPYPDQQRVEALISGN